MRVVFNTTLVFTGDEGNDCEAQARVVTDVYPGFKGDQIDPPESPGVYIVSVRGIKESEGLDLSRFEDSEELRGEAIAEWQAGEIEAAEWRAQSRRDQMMEGF